MSGGSLVYSAIKPVVFVIVTALVTLFIYSGREHLSQVLLNEGTLLEEAQQHIVRNLMSNLTGSDSTLASSQISSSEQRDAREHVADAANTTMADLLKIFENLYEFANLPTSDFFQHVDHPKQCPSIPPSLVGPIKIYRQSFQFELLNRLNMSLSPGGHYEPGYCVPKQRLAVIIPYRNREKHLSVLLLNLHPLLQKQQLAYTIFIVNQVENSKFNRGMLLNVGYFEALRSGQYDCFVFHDVDLIPENDMIIYDCLKDNPRHLSVAVDKFDYQLPYPGILGGVVAIQRELFFNVNGYSNLYFGWGGEDDDFSYRISGAGYKIIRYPASISRYVMIRHNVDTNNEANPERFNMLTHTQERQDHDGLNSLVYKLVSTELHPLYTQINVNIDQVEVMNARSHRLELSDLIHPST